jgi:hypothetical protein
LLVPAGGRAGDLSHLHLLRCLLLFGLLVHDVLLLMLVDLLHLVLIGLDVHLLILHFVFCVFLTILLQHLLLLQGLSLLFHQEHLLDLLLSEVLVDHLLLGREAIVFDLLLTALDLDFFFVFLLDLLVL